MVYPIGDHRVLSGLLSVMPLSLIAPEESGSLECGSLESGFLESCSLECGSLECASLESGSLESGSLECGSLESGSHAMASQSFTHQRLGFAVVILFPNCPPTYKHKTASVILFYICILLEPLLFLNRLVHFYHAHTNTPGKCVVCAYVLLLVCVST